MIVSACCHGEIIRRHETEFPLGGIVWGIDCSYDACAECGEEIYETVECEE